MDIRVGDSIGAERLLTLHAQPACTVRDSTGSPIARLDRVVKIVGKVFNNAQQPRAMVPATVVYGRPRRRDHAPRRRNRDKGGSSIHR
jgi:hypothetical protein